MRKNLILFTLLLITAIPAKAQAPDWGVADTLAHHPLGPGIQYTNIYFQGKRMLVWVTEIDLTNPYNKIEQVQSRHQVPDVQRWTVQEHYIQNTRPGHKVCVAFNHDFFAYEAGACIGINISDGEIPYGDGWGRSLIAINEQKEIGVFKPALDANIILPDKSKVKIDNFNSQAQGIAGNCVLFNRFNARTLTDGGKYIKILPKTTWTVNGEDVECEVLEISDQPLQTTQTEYVIYLRGEKQTAIDGKLTVGNTIYISQKMDDGTFGTPLENILNAFHGYPSIAFEGQLHDGEYNNFENGRENEISSRQMAGMSRDGKTLYMLTTEMSPTSAGVDCVDVANYMLANGSWNVVNFDSGGSTAIVVDKEMLNYPARGSVRPVQDAMLAVSLAPESAEITSFRFLVPSVTTSIASEVPLTLLAFNQYDEVLDKSATGFTFTCRPETIGYVDEEQVFHAGTQSGQGIIVAEKDGKRAELRITVKAADNINITPDNILIDDIRTYPVNVEAVVGNNVFNIDPAVLQWLVNDSRVCSVENGILKGLESGSTIVTGVFGNTEKELEVTVESGKGILLVESFDDPSVFELKTVGAGNFSFSSNGLPAGWKHGSVMDFNFKITRAPYIELSKDIRFYGLPDSVSLMVKNDGGIIDQIEFYLENVSGDRMTQKLSLRSEGEQRIVVPFMEQDEMWDIRNFPITLTKIRMNLDSDTDGEKYQVAIGSLSAHYPGGETAVPENKKENNNFEVYTFGDDIIINFDLNETADIGVFMSSIDGRIIKSQVFKNIYSGKQELKLNASGISNGVYVIRMMVNEKSYSQKMIISSAY